MPAIVRVKRRIDEEPLSAFVLNGKKRQRLENESASGVGGAPTTAAPGLFIDDLEGTLAGKEEISTILKFAGTIKDQDDAATTQLARLTKEQAKELVQQKQRKAPTTNHTERSRQEMRQSLHENRFRVVNCMRTTLDEFVDDGSETTEDAANEDNNQMSAGMAAAANVGADEAGAAKRTKRMQSKQITIVDIEKQQATDATLNSNATASGDTPSDGGGGDNGNAAPCGQPQRPSDSDTGYVYDLYIPENEQQSDYVDMMDDNYLSVRAFDDLLYQERFNNDSDDDEYDSEDSNQENYFGNDYPDDEEEDSVGGNSSASGEYEDAREMRRAVENFVLADDDADEDEEDEMYDMSSDDEKHDEYADPYVHTLDKNDESFVDDVDAYVDAECRTDSYARFNVLYN